MAVAYSGTHEAALGTGASLATGSISVSGSNPVIMVAIGVESGTISSVTFGGSGTATQIINITAGTSRTAIYAIVAPSGSGAVTANFDASRAGQISAALFTGADQTTPCPTGDAVSSTANSTSINLTPANLTANDGSFGAQGHTILEDCNGVSPNELYRNSTTAINLQSGYRIGTGAITCAITGSTFGNTSTVAARIAAAAAGGDAVPQCWRQYRGRRTG